MSKDESAGPDAVGRSPSLTTPHSSEAYTYLVIGNVFVVRWWGTANAENLAHLLEAVATASRRIEGKFYFFAIIPSSEGVPSAEMRNTLLDFNVGLAALGAEIHLAVLGRGIKNAIIRSVASLFRNRRIPISVHNSVHTALQAVEKASGRATEPIHDRLRQLNLVD